MGVFEEIREVGGWVWLEDGNVCFESDYMKEDLIERLRRVKPWIKKYLELEQKLIRAGWQVGVRFNTYAFQVSRSGMVCIFEERGKWHAYYLKHDVNGRLIKESRKYDDYDFNEAIKAAHKSIKWFKDEVTRVPWEIPELEKIEDIPVWEM